MTITQSILAVTDFSEGARVGLEKAAELAELVGARVTLCHVLDPSPLAPIAGLGEAAQRLAQEQDVEKALHEALQATLEEFFSGVEDRKSALVISPGPSRGICRYAEKEDTDLIVISTHGRTGLAHLLIGSVAEKVVRHAPCPVLTVRTPLG